MSQLDPFFQALFDTRDQVDAPLHVGLEEAQLLHREPVPLIHPADRVPAGLVEQVQLVTLHEVLDLGSHPPNLDLARDLFIGTHDRPNVLLPVLEQRSSAALRAKCLPGTHSAKSVPWYSNYRKVTV
jgi:hypothetical protein